MFAMFGKLIRGPTGRSLMLAALVVAVLAVAMGVTSRESAAQAVMPHEQIVNLLKARYGETPVARGLVQNGWMIEVFATAQGDTWTIVFTTPEGVSRVGSAGVAWSQLDEGPERLSRLTEAD